MVAVQVHRMHLATAVLYMRYDNVALAYDEHRDIWIDVAVDRPPHPWATADKSGSTSDHVVEPASWPGGVEAERCRRPVRQRVQLPAKLRRCRRVAAAGSDDHCDRLR